MSLRKSVSQVKVALTALLIAAFCRGARPAERVPLAAFLKTYCLDCHSADDPSGEREFASLNLQENTTDAQLRLQEIVDQLTLKSMPPEDGEQPSEQERLDAISRFTEILARQRAATSSTGGKTVLRRLNRREYRNTVSDLLGIEMSMFDPTQEFPDDNLSLGFDNIGSQLSLSGFLLEKYLHAAEACVEKAFGATGKVEPQTWNFRERFYQQPELRGAHEKAFRHRYLVLYDHPRNDKPEGAYGPLATFKTGVPTDGIYQIRVLATALHRDTPYGAKAIHIDTTEPFRMGIRPGDTRISDQVHTQPIEPLLAEAVIADNDLQWYEFEVPLDKGFVPRFTFENGQHDVRGAYGRVFRHHRNTLPKSVRQGKGIVAFRNAVINHGFLPQIRIHEVRVHGPLSHSPQRSNYESLIGGTSFSSEKAPSLLRKYAERALRRPVTNEELQPYVSLYEKRIEQGREPLEAYKDGLKAVLCSPAFLFLRPPPSSSLDDELDSHALAERLAYFLTSSMPDEALRHQANQDRLKNRDALRQETRRLLRHSTSSRFVADFLDNWLKLRLLGSMPPDAQGFREYYTAGLEPEMKRETQLFFRDLIDRNGSVLELLDSRHSFVNRDLAKLYGVQEQVPAEQAAEFHRVEFTDLSRGGLLGQASVLTVSANGIETSPVVRGVWILENILGTPPPPPPDDVPAIDPDVRGSVSIRAQLEKHRESATCNQCHRKIDPLGFALECFDPIGRTRNFYDKKKKRLVDTSGVLPGGHAFQGPAELRGLLLRRREFFVRTVTNQLLAHALGRHIEPIDRPSVDAILNDLKDRNYPMRDLILEIVSSELFRRH